MLDCHRNYERIYNKMTRLGFLTLGFTFVDMTRAGLTDSSSVKK